MKVSLKRKFFNNTSWMMAQNIYSMLLSLVIGSLTARYLGPSNYGLLSYGASIITFFTIISKLGMDSLVVAEMVKTPEKRQNYLGSALVLRLVASVLSFFSIIITVEIIEPNNIMLQVVTLLQAFAVIFNSSEVLYYWFQLKLSMKYVAIATMVALSVTGIWRIALLIMGASVEWFALSASLSALVCGITTVILFKRMVNIKLRFSLQDSKFLLSNSYHFLISGLAVTLYLQIDKIMLGKIVSTEAVGFYSAATTIAALWQFVPNALINSSRPLIVANYKDNYNIFKKNLQILLLGITIIAIVVSLIFTFFGKFIIYILYGGAFNSAITPLSILIWSTGFAMIGTARGIWIVSEGLYKYTKYYIFIGATINLTLNFVFIPIWGIIGASVTNLISQIVVCFIAPLFFKRTREFVFIYFDSFSLIPELWYQLKMIVRKKIE